MPILNTYKFEEVPIKTDAAIDWMAFSLLSVLWTYLLSWSPQFSTDLPPNSVQSVSHLSIITLKVLLSPRTTKLWRGYRVCPVRMYVSTYVRSFVRMFTRSKDLIYYPISIELHTSIGYDNTSNKFAFQRDRVKVKVAVTIFRKTLSSL